MAHLGGTFSPLRAHPFFSVQSRLLRKLSRQPQTLINLPKSRIYGAELELAVRPVEDLALNVGLGLLKTEIREGSVSGASVVGNRLAATREVSALKSLFGVRQRIVDPDEALAIEPGLGPVRAQIAGALYSPDEEVGDPFRFCSGAATAIGSSERGTLLFNVSIDRIDVDGPRPTVRTSTGRKLAADRVVLCAGYQSQALARTFGVWLPILPMKGYSITAPPGEAAPRVSVTDAATARPPGSARRR